MSLLKGILNKFSSRDRRKGDRVPAPELAAFFWTGGTPVEHRIRNISSSGLYLVTEDAWFPGTLIMITLQNKDVAEGDPGQAVVVQARVIRKEEDGVGVHFVFSDANDSRRSENILKGGVSRKTLDKFLKSLLSDNGRAIVTSVLPPSDRF